ncbi:MAG: hypothetical protein ACOCP8_06055 [archaeon]
MKKDNYKIHLYEDYKKLYDTRGYILPDLKSDDHIITTGKIADIPENFKIIANQKNNNNNNNNIINLLFVGIGLIILYLLFFR